MVWMGPGAPGVGPRFAGFGAQEVYVADSPDSADHPVAPAGELHGQLVESASPTAVTAGPDGAPVAEQPTFDGARLPCTRR
jgi:hypothetical protein